MGIIRFGIKDTLNQCFSRMILTGRRMKAIILLIRSAWASPQASRVVPISVNIECSSPSSAFVGDSEYLAADRLYLPVLAVLGQFYLP